MISPEAFRLRTEQEFELARFAIACADLSDGELQELLLDTVARLMDADNQIRKLILGGFR
ncbi:MAG: hypothetical protein ACRC62_15720 [Microcoleus sp.]